MEGDFQVGNWLIQPHLNRIVGAEKESSVRLKVMEVLVYLAKHADEVLPKERIIQAVWPDAFVSDQVLTNAISALRKAFDDGPDQEEVIQTIPRRGYRLIPEVKKPEPDVSRYRIVKKLGQGAMGEVYLGEDTLLRRKVALKFVSRDKQEDESFRRRLLREARAAAALDHPFICKIYTVGELEGKDFISMEYVQGQTVKQKLQASSLTTREVLEIAVEMAEALEEAHSQSIVHRDLKPANIMLTEQGHVKITDFGLAKWVPLVEGEEQEYTETLTREVSTEGTIPYMSPEQVTGKKVDPRSDIFSFGVVLYEMLTGVNPFRKSLPMETAAAIQMAEVPRIQEYVEGTPEGLEAVLGTMLAKKPERRQGSIGEVRESLVELLEEEERSPAQPLKVIQKADLQVGRSTTVAGAKPAIFTKLAPWIAGIVLAVTGFAVWYLKPQPPEEPSRVVRSVIPTPQTAPLWISRFYPDVAISPDGRQIVYVAGSQSERQLYLRSVDQLEATPIGATEGSFVRSPFFSSDGRDIGFGDTRELKKVSLRGGPAKTICAVGGDGFDSGVSWGEDGSIIFGVGGMGLFRVPAGGGEPRVVTTPDPEKGEQEHGWPEFLPGGKSILFTILTDRGRQIAVLDLETAKHKRLNLSGSHPHYSPTGHIVYALQEAVWAVPFDLKSREVTGGPAPVLEEVNFKTLGGAANFSLSDEGSLVYVPGGPLSVPTLVWVDREGKEEEVGAPPRFYLMPRVSPDGTRIAVVVQGDLWIYDLVHGTLERLTRDPARGSTPLWTPDGQRVVFASNREGSTAVYWKAADGTGQVDLLAKGPNDLMAFSWSGDGQLVTNELGERSWDIGVLSMEGEGSRRLLLQEEFNEFHPAVSPDGRWIAYQSEESGQLEIYVRPFPNVEEGRWQISRGSNDDIPLWSPDGRELFYFSGNKMMAVAIQSEPNFTYGAPAQTGE